MNAFHYLARGVIMVDGKVLVVKAIGANNTFLPGGHIEMGEQAKNTVAREIKEEIGLQAVVTDFLGAVEHTWQEEGRDNFEINLVFKVETSGLTIEEPPDSKEAHLLFNWLHPSELDSNNLEPAPLIELIKSMEKSNSSFWGSTL